MKINARNFLLSTLTASCSVFAAQTIEIPPGTSHEDILKLANKCTPHRRQLEYQQLEFTGFIHFGPNTFTGREWGSGKENAQAFAPEGLDTDQWCRVAKEAGMKMMVITMKHHDGFCTWQTRYNEKFSVKAVEWRDGKGDVLRELTNSCRKYGLKLGVYLSPADLYQIENEEGLYGNMSKYQDSVIPTSPEHFKTNPMIGRKPPEGKPVLNYKVDDYNRYFLNQLYELLTEYGEIHEVWFDGAHPKRKGGQTYTYDYWYDIVRKLAPNAIIEGKGPDARWIGNEHGGTRQQEWTPMPMKKVKGMWEMGDRRGEKKARDENLKTAEAIHWYPAELDVSLRYGWFYRNEKQGVRSADNIFDIYERSVGGNSLCLLNIPPNKQGRFADRDVAVLKEVGRRIKATYGVSLVDDAQGEKTLLDGNIETGIIVGPKGTVIELDGVKKLNRFVVQEAIMSHGQRTKAFALDARINGQWQQIAEGGTIGYKNILRFENTETNALRLRVLDSRAGEAVKIAEVNAHYFDQPPLPVISVRQADKVILKVKGAHNSAPMAIHYTLDGSEPNFNSPVFTNALHLPKGAHLKARTASNGRLGSVMTSYIGLHRRAWKFTSSSDDGKNTIAKAFDGNRKSQWLTKSKLNHPHTLTIDLGSAEVIKALAYLPNHRGRTPGMVEEFRIETSLDGKTWTNAGEGTFGNLVNDPSRRFHWFESPQKLRYFKFISLRGAAGTKVAGAAEIDLLGY